ncbi:MAG: hypothetical protein IKG18_18560 [Atopobiaceae bacterium]|nr:hypothetical protein [Atopobiaceae bacterium]
MADDNHNAASPSDQNLGDELAFLAAMRKFRQAREQGDPESIAQAEKELQEVVRGELRRQESGCA